MEPVDEQIPIEPKQDPQGKTFFIGNINTSVGQSLVEELRNDHLILSGPGTHSESENAPIPSGVDRLVKKEKTRPFKQIVLSCDIILYDLQSSDLEEVDYVLKMLKTNEFENEKILILISTVMTWVNTPAKEKKEIQEGGDEEGDQVDEEEEEEEEEEDAEAEGGEESKEEDIGEEKPPKKKYLAFKESEYFLRVPSAKYQSLKAIETLALSASKSQPKLKIYVLCAGILYGNGENVFYEHFKSAWLQNPEKLPYIGNGKNLIPTIHLNDLAKLAKRVVEKKPDIPYIFAIDRTKKSTQRSIVEAISKGIGTGLTQTVNLKDVIESPWSEFLNINLKMKPSILFKDDEPPEDAEDPEAEAEKLKFKWHSELGIAENINKLNEEFNVYRGLVPVKIFISGPPASGKTHFSQKIASFYNIPHIHVQEVANEARQLNNELGEEIRAKMEEDKDKLIEEMEKEQAKSKKKNQPEIDREKVIPKISEELLNKVFRLKLSQNACRNRGYVLDGYPKSYKDAQQIFLIKKKKFDEEGNEVQEEEDPEAEIKLEDYEIDTKISPTSIIVLKGEADFLKQRVKELPEDKIAETHFTDEGMSRRIKHYTETNYNEKGDPAVEDLFSDYNIDVFSDDCATPEKALLNSLKIYIERVFYL